MPVVIPRRREWVDLDVDLLLDAPHMDIAKKGCIQLDAIQLIPFAFSAILLYINSVVQVPMQTYARINNNCAVFRDGFTPLPLDDMTCKKTIYVYAVGKSLDYSKDI